MAYVFHYDFFQNTFETTLKWYRFYLQHSVVASLSASWYRLSTCYIHFNYFIRLCVTRVLFLLREIIILLRFCRFIAIGKQSMKTKKACLLGFKTSQTRQKAHNITKRLKYNCITQNLMYFASPGKSLAKLSQDDTKRCSWSIIII